MTDSNLPTFIIIGAAKCGTTTICDLLAAHPDIFITTPKEPAFFSNNEIYKRGIDWYKSLFNDGMEYKARGEGSVNYSKVSDYPDCAKRIAEALPEVKLIYMTRDPLKQIESSWKYKWLTHFETRPFKEAIMSTPSYFEACNYHLQISEYKKYFSEDQILVLFLEDLSSNPDLVISNILEFINIDKNIKIDLKKQSNVSLGKSRESRIVQILRRSEMMYYLRKIFSSKTRAKISRLLRSRNKKMETAPSWDEDTLKYALDKIAPQTYTFLSQYGKPDDFWLTQTPSTRTPDRD